MKKIIALFLCCVLTFGVTGVAASADDNSGIALCNNNVMLTESNFYTDATGYAEILVSYYGYPGITTGGVITTKLQRQNGTSWDDVEDWVETATGDTFDKVYILQLTERGTYRVQIEYRVSGTGGPDDVINEEYTRTY